MIEFKLRLQTGTTFVNMGAGLPTFKIRCYWEESHPYIIENDPYSEIGKWILTIDGNLGDGYVNIITNIPITVGNIITAPNAYTGFGDILIDSSRYNNVTADMEYVNCVFIEPDEVGDFYKLMRLTP